jgi:hypothetical protein
VADHRWWPGSLLGLALNCAAPPYRPNDTYRRDGAKGRWNDNPFDADNPNRIEVLRALAAVAATNHFTRAAERLET